MSALSKKVWGGSAILILTWGLIIFLPAWTLNYWQGWIYFLIFSLISLIGTWYFMKKDPKLIERRLHPGPAAEKEKSQKIIQSVIMALSFLLIIGPGLDRHFGWSKVPAVIVIVSNIIFASGYLIIFRVFRENSFASSIIEVDKEQKVISTGPYAIVRHPMYSGAILWFLFSPLAMGSYYIIPVAVMICAMLAVRIIYEEKYLLQNLSGYKEYCGRVRYRLIPFIW